MEKIKYIASNNKWELIVISTFIGMITLLLVVI